MTSLEYDRMWGRSQLFTHWNLNSPQGGQYKLDLMSLKINNRKKRNRCKANVYGKHLNLKKIEEVDECYQNILYKKSQKLI